MSYDNVYACAVNSSSATAGETPFDDERGFQCVELANRFLWDVWGDEPIRANGDSFASAVHDTYPSVLLVRNGTVGEPYLPGDIVSFTSNSHEPDGHVAVVMASTENSSGSGLVTIMEQNAALAGYETLTVSKWSLEQGPGSYVTPSNFIVFSGVPTENAPFATIRYGTASRAKARQPHTSGTSATTAMSTSSCERATSSCGTTALPDRR